MIRRRALPPVAVAVSMLAAAPLLSGCGDPVTPVKVTSTGNAQEAQAPQTQVFRPGDAIRMGDVIYRVNGIRDLSGDALYRPSEGRRWIAVDITVQNAGGEPFAVSSLMQFELQEDTGYRHNVAILPVSTKGSIDGNVPPGRSVRGEVPFEVTAEAKSFELIITHDLAGSQAVVSLGGL